MARNVIAQRRRRGGNVFIVIDMVCASPISESVRALLIY
jgi:hypothetical protein